MENIYFLLIIGLIFWYFVYLRKVSEFAGLHANKYCENEQLQFIAIARRSSKLRFSKRDGIYWYSVFDLEFSGDGESKHQGVLCLKGYKLERVELPVYRVH